MPSDTPHTHEDTRHRFWLLTLGSLGVVYGDIGTSPLYAFREAVHAVGGAGAETAAILGVLSLIIWALILVVTLKYVAILLYADNRGEGGTLSLMALAQSALLSRPVWLLWAGIAAAALFYGDSIITPAISVLSAVEGLKLVTPAFSPFVLPAAVIILVALFVMQPYGTGRVGNLFGPICALWFLVLAVSGLWHIAQNPYVLVAFNPVYGFALLHDHADTALLILGAVFLAVTGGEALYADLGHFGRRPIQVAWVGLVLPGLVLNYLGQGALVLASPTALENPFFLMVGPQLLLPMVGLATLATVIASQAVITGAYSMTQQAIHLGLLPRLHIKHTSADHQGQIFMPKVNWMLLLGVIFLVFMFQSSSRLAAAYGIAVAGTMVVTMVMAFVVIWKVWRVRLPFALVLFTPLLLIDLTFLIANSQKLMEGGVLPLMLGAVIFTFMMTWRSGTLYLNKVKTTQEIPMSILLNSLHHNMPKRVEGTAVFLTADPERAPMALLHNLKHNKVLHRNNVILCLRLIDRPRISDDERVSLQVVDRDFTILTLRYGFMEIPHVIKGLALARRKGLELELFETVFFLSRRILRAVPEAGLPLWQARLYVFMAAQADNAATFFRIPDNQVMEIGAQVKI